MAKDPKLVRPNGMIVGMDLGAASPGIYDIPLGIHVREGPMNVTDFAKEFLDNMTKMLGLSYEDVVKLQYPPMAVITPKMRRLLRSADRRKRKRGARLYWAAPGEHSVGRLQGEIAQGNFGRSKILIRGRFSAMADSLHEFSTSALKGAAAVNTFNAQIGAIRAGKTAFVEHEIERMRAADPDAKILVIKPRGEK